MSNGAGCSRALLSLRDTALNSVSMSSVDLPPPETRREPTSWVTLSGAREHNLKNVTVKIPLGVMVAVTGVSGAGKSSLINATLFPALNRMLHRSLDRVGPYDSLTGLGKVDKCIVIDQQPIGRTPAPSHASHRPPPCLADTLNENRPAW